MRFAPRMASLVAFRPPSGRVPCAHRPSTRTRSRSSRRSRLERVLSGIDTSEGCGVKDSFASLGPRRRWIPYSCFGPSGSLGSRRRILTRPLREGGSGANHSEAELRDWEATWRGARRIELLPPSPPPSRTRGIGGARRLHRRPHRRRRYRQPKHHSDRAQQRLRRGRRSRSRMGRRRRRSSSAVGGYADREL